MWIEDSERWLFTVAVRKVVTAVVKLGIAYITSVQVQQVITHLGLTVDAVKLQAELTVALLGGIEVCHDWLRLRFPEVIKF